MDMIYILSGNDIKKKRAYRDTLTKNLEVISLPSHEIEKGVFLQHAGGVSLFGEVRAIIADNVLVKGEVVFTTEELSQLKDSPTCFIFLEDKLLVADERKYKKYADIVRFDQKIQPKSQPINTFAIADAFGSRDKIKAWVLYREAIDMGVEPEAISGILFWKIKTLLLNGTKLFSQDVLQEYSGELVSLYHTAHRGEVDFTIGLEQFLLSSLSK